MALTTAGTIVMKMDMMKDIGAAKMVKTEKYAIVKVIQVLISVNSQGTTIKLYCPW